MKEFNNEDFGECVKEAMAYIENLRTKYEKLNYTFPINISSCRWALQQSIINRRSTETMSKACMRYIDTINYQVKVYNNI